MKLFQVNNDQNKRILSILNSLYSKKVITYNEKIELSRIFENLHYGDVNKAEMLLEKNNQYLFYQVKRILSYI
ncbi:hypothetical protein J6TS2_35030 [Heyndrickxia sporothermodurans]|nr:hypothetical protein J6TS2_35030 [Heyndrickxia sporothermodurans]